LTNRPSNTLASAIAASFSEPFDRRPGFDAIVVGAGAAGGLAAMQLTQAGLDVLVLDAGWTPPFWRAPARRSVARLVTSIADPRLQQVLPPRAVMLGRRALRVAGKLFQPVQSRCFAWELAPDAFVDDRECPYVNEAGSRFDWFRARQVGGRMTIPGHGRQYYRLAPQDFDAADGMGPGWPLRYSDLDPWYRKVEDLLALSGGEAESEWAPRGGLAEIVPPSAAETQVIAAVKGRWSAVQPILGRFAPPLASMDAAAATGRLWCRTGAVAMNVQVAPDEKVSGVRWHDRATGRPRAASAPIVFLCASSLETTRILLSSESASGLRDIGARSGTLGRGLMDHIILSAEGVGGELPGEPVDYRPGPCVYLPRFDLRDGDQAQAGRFGVQIYRWSTGRGRSHFNAVSFGEMSARAENAVRLDPVRRDRWGVPALRIQCRHDARDLALAEAQARALSEIGELFGVSFLRMDRRPAAPGSAMHECGTARMGKSPEDSVLDPFNQCWDVGGLYVTDGSAFPASGIANPTLTILALTMRACARASGGEASPAAESHTRNLTSA
jgi:choline dehydrogenase-like flavoprotein